jgi:AbrB family looped-hinge helix DNA binding protein
METTLSTKGQIVLPRSIRQKLALRPGTKFSSRVVNGTVVLTPRTPSAGRPRLVRDAATGLTVTQGAETGAVVTNESIRALLADFP